MYYLSRVIIKNFKSCYDLDLKLSEYNPIVGQNNTGKTNILMALSWALKPTLLKENDFFNKENAAEVILEVAELNDETIDSLFAKSQALSLKNALNGSKTLKVRVTQEPNTKKTAEIKKEFFRFDITPNDWGADPNGTHHVLKALFEECLLIEANDNLNDDLGKIKQGNSVEKLLKLLKNKLLDKHASQIKSDLSFFSDTFSFDGDSRDEDISSFESTINKSISQFYSNVDVKINIPVPTPDDLMKKLDLKIFEKDHSSISDFGNLGLGAQRSIQMGIVNALSSLGESKKKTLLFIDEPELFLHPQAIYSLKRSLLSLAQKNNYQVIFPTHSVLFIAEKYDTEEVLLNTSIIYKENGRTRVKERLGELISKNKELKRIDFLLSIENLMDTLFNDKFLLVEGKTDDKALPIMFEKLKNKKLQDNNIAILKVEGKESFLNVVKIISQIGDTKVLADLDFMFTSRKKLNIDDKELEYCFEWLSKNAGELNFSLKHNLPTKEANKLTPHEVFELLGSDPICHSEINKVQQKLISKNIWIWSRGALESIIGISKKQSKEFDNTLSLFSEGAGDIKYDDEFHRFTDWVFE